MDPLAPTSLDMLIRFLTDLFTAGLTAAALALVPFLGRTAYLWLKTKAASSLDAQVYAFTKVIVKAAEQQLRSEGGQAKLMYVATIVTQRFPWIPLVQARAIIEACVHELSLYMQDYDMAPMAPAPAPAAVNVLAVAPDPSAVLPDNVPTEILAAGAVAPPDSLPGAVIDAV